MHYSRLHRVKNINFNGQSKKTDFLCARLGCIHLVQRYLRHHTYKGCLVMILGSHAEVSGSMLRSIRQNYCNIYEKLIYPLSKAYKRGTSLKNGVLLVMYHSLKPIRIQGFRVNKYKGE